MAHKILQKLNRDWKIMRIIGAGSEVWGSIHDLAPETYRWSWREAKTSCFVAGPSLDNKALDLFSLSLLQAVRAPSMRYLTSVLLRLLIMEGRAFCQLIEDSPVGSIDLAYIFQRLNSCLRPLVPKC